MLFTQTYRTQLNAFNEKMIINLNREFSHEDWKPSVGFDHVEDL
jgi:hypothetical protein